MAVVKVLNDTFFVSVDLIFSYEIAPAAMASAIFFHSWVALSRKFIIFALVKLLFYSKNHRKNGKNLQSCYSFPRVLVCRH